MKLFTVHISVVSRYLILLRSKYLPQYPILKHPQPVFFRHGDRPSFTPIQNNSKKIIVLCILMFICRQTVRIWKGYVVKYNYVN